MAVKFPKDAGTYFRLVCQAAAIALRSYSSTLVTARAICRKRQPYPRALAWIFGGKLVCGSVLGRLAFSAQRRRFVAADGNLTREYARVGTRLRNTLGAGIAPARKKHDLRATSLNFSILHGTARQPERLIPRREDCVQNAYLLESLVRVETGRGLRSFAIGRLTLCFRTE
jgi:hypothetical protein